MFLARVFRISLWSSFLADSYAMLMRPINAETAVHGCTARAIWLCAYVSYWPNCGLVFECVTCFYCCFWMVGGIEISSEKRAGWAGLTRTYGLETRIWAPFCGSSKILISTWINTKKLFLMRTREHKFHGLKKIAEAHEKFHHQFDFTIIFKRFK